MEDEGRVCTRTIHLFPQARSRQPEEEVLAPSPSPRSATPTPTPPLSKSLSTKTRTVGGRGVKGLSGVGRALRVNCEVWEDHVLPVLVHACLAGSFSLGQAGEEGS